MHYSLKQAAKVTGKDRSTIQRAIKSGRLSAKTTEAGTYEIDPAELHRVFPFVVRNEGESVATQQNAPPATAGENRELAATIEHLRDLLSRIEGERDEWREQCKRMTLLLQAPPSTQQSAPPQTSSTLPVIVEALPVESQPAQDSPASPAQASASWWTARPWFVVPLVVVCLGLAAVILWNAQK